MFRKINIVIAIALFLCALGLTACSDGTRTSDSPSGDQPINVGPEFGSGGDDGIVDGGEQGGGHEQDPDFEIKDRLEIIKPPSLEITKTDDLAANVKPVEEDDDDSGKIGIIDKIINIFKKEPSYEVVPVPGGGQTGGVQPGGQQKSGQVGGVQQTGNEYPEPQYDPDADGYEASGWDEFADSLDSPGGGGIDPDSASSDAGTGGEEQAGSGSETDEDTGDYDEQIDILEGIPGPDQDDGAPDSSSGEPGGGGGGEPDADGTPGEQNIDDHVGAGELSTNPGSSSESYEDDIAENTKAIEDTTKGVEGGSGGGGGGGGSTGNPDPILAPDGNWYKDWAEYEKNKDTKEADKKLEKTGCEILEAMGKKCEVSEYLTSP